MPVEHNKINPRWINITAENYHEVINDPTKYVVVIYVDRFCRKSRELIISYNEVMDIDKAMDDDRDFFPNHGIWKDLILATIDMGENEIEGIDFKALP